MPTGNTRTPHVGDMGIVADIELRDRLVDLGGFLHHGMNERQIAQHRKVIVLDTPKTR